MPNATPPTTPPDLSKYGLTPAPSSLPLVPVGGHVSQVYRTEPGKPLPNPVPDFQDWELVVAGPGAGLRGYALYRSPRLNPSPKPLPNAPAGIVVTPTPVPPTPAPPPVTPPPVTQAPQLPLITRYVATTPGQDTPFAAYFVNRTADQTLENSHVEGFKNGLVAQNCKGGLTVRNCRFVGNFGPGQFDGQGAYLSAVLGPIDFVECVFSRNGRPSNQPQYTPTMFRHGSYAQGDATGPTFTRCWFDGNANAQTQFRNAGKSIDCLFTDSGTGVLGVMGNIQVSGGLFLGSHLWFDGSNWTGGTAIQLYGTAALNDNLIVGAVGQCTQPPTNSKPAAKLFQQACIVTGGWWNNGDHPPFVPPPAGAPYIVGAGNRIVGWNAPAFGGQTPHNGDGFTVTPGPGIGYDWTPTLAAVLKDNTISVADAIARVKADVARLLAAAPNN